MTAHGTSRAQYIREVTLKREQVPSFARYPFALEAVRNLSRMELHPKVTYFIGENGSGKSTLLEAIAVSWGFNPEGGTKNFRFGTRPSHSQLHEYLRLVKGVRRPRDGFSSGRRASSMWQPRSRISIGSLHRNRP